MARDLASREMEQQFMHKQAEMAGAYNNHYEDEMDDMEMDDEMNGHQESYNPLRYKQWKH